MKRVLLINQHDSFVYNLVQTFRKATPTIDCRVMDYNYLDEDEALTYDDSFYHRVRVCRRTFRGRFPYCAAGLISRRRALCWASVWPSRIGRPVELPLQAASPPCSRNFLNLKTHNACSPTHAGNKRCCTCRPLSQLGLRSGTRRTFYNRCPDGRG